jgi:hypothetical protein
MHEILTIFVILLVLLLIISTLGGSIRFNEKFEEPVEVDMNAYAPPAKLMDDVKPPAPAQKFEDDMRPKLRDTPPKVAESDQALVEPFDNDINFATIA